VNRREEVSKDQVGVKRNRTDDARLRKAVKPGLKPTAGERQGRSSEAGKNLTDPREDPRIDQQFRAQKFKKRGAPQKRERQKKRKKVHKHREHARKKERTPTAREGGGPPPHSRAPKTTASKEGGKRQALRDTSSDLVNTSSTESALRVLSF